MIIHIGIVIIITVTIIIIVIIILFIIIQRKTGTFVPFVFFFVQCSVASFEEVFVFWNSHETPLGATGWPWSDVYE